MTSVRLYLDQMLRADLAEFLRESGCDVVRASDTGQARANDADILKMAVRDNRTLVTMDKHFGDWVVLPLSEHLGVIRINTHPPTTRNITSLLLPFLKNYSQGDFKNALIILSSSRVRWIRTSDENRS